MARDCPLFPVLNDYDRFTKFRLVVYYLIIAELSELTDEANFSKLISNHNSEKARNNIKLLIISVESL